MMSSNKPRGALAAAVIAFSVFAGAPTAHSWIGTQAAVGVVKEIQVTNLHDLFYVSVKMSVPLGRCESSEWFHLAAQEVNHKDMIRLLTMAKISGRAVHVWHEMVTFTVFGTDKRVCIARQISLE